MLELAVVIFSVTANIVLAVLVFAQNSRKKVNKYFAFFALILVGWTTTNYISLHPIGFDQLFWIRLDMSWATALSMAVFLLTNIFPSGEAFYSSLEKWIIPPALLIASLAMTPWLFTSVDYSSGEAEPVPGPFLVPFAMYSLGALILSLMILIRRFHTLKGRAKEYIRYALLGVIVMFSLIVFFNFILVVVFHNTAFIVFTPALVLLFSISFAYGMVRHRLFDIRLIVARFIAYLLLSLFVSIVYSLAVVLVSYFIVGEQPNSAQIIISTIAVSILVLFVQPLRRFFNQVTRAIFYQDAYDTKTVLDSLASVLVRSTNTDIVANNSLSILQQALKPDYIALVLLHDVKAGHHKTIQIGQTNDEFAKVVTPRFLDDIPDVVSLDALEDQSNRMRINMQKANIGVAARLETLGEVIGYCLFGLKTSGSIYSQRDIDLIRIACDELAVAVQNALRFEQIQAFNKTLRQRIEDATKELRANNLQLKQLDEAKDEFVSMASHQLRTPLTSVKGYISMVLEGDAGKLTGMQRQLLGEAYTSSERMVHLINDFLNVSRLQTGKFTLERRATDLSKVVTHEVDSLQTTAKAHKLTLAYRPPSYFPILYLDEAKVGQVVMNFIDNAIYYSPEHSTITITLEVVEGNAILTVHDEGIGVPKDEQVHLFTKFFRATNARKHRPDGTGVGLFLAKKVVVAHGGTMVFTSVKDEGSTFGFRLPIKKLSVAPAKDTNKLDK